MASSALTKPVGTTGHMINYGSTHIVANKKKVILRFHQEFQHVQTKTNA